MLETASDEARLDEILALHMMRADAGKTVDRQQLYSEHPEFADQLRGYYEVSDHLYHLIDSSGDATDAAQVSDYMQTLQVDDTRPRASISGSPKRVFGDYDLLDVIAKGGMGVVYKARQRKLNRIVAVKMILAGQFADQLDIDRFYAEATAAANLRHPSIVQIHEIGECQGQHFFSMDYIEGQSLVELVRENPLPPARAAHYVKTIAETVQFAHEHGVLHRDLKPSNVLLDRKDHPLLTDFGLAKQVEGQGQSQLTMSGAIVGTPSYMPPEQAAGHGDQVSVRSDVYSTGAMLYELLTGRPPFRSANPFETIKQVIESEPVSPRLLNPSIPVDLETICLKCLQKEPPARYASAQQLADELGRYLAGEPILARPIGRLARSWRWCRRNPVIASLSAAALCFLLLALLATTVGYLQTTAALAEARENFQQARQAVDELYTQVSEDTLLNQPGMQPLRESLLRRALVYYERFRAQRSNDPSIQDEIALTTFRIGLITEAIKSPEKALVEYQHARQMQEQLLLQKPKDPARLEALGNTWTAMGRAWFQMKRFEDALSAYGKAVEVRERLVHAESGQSEFERLRANGYMNLGLVEKAQGDMALAAGDAAGAQRHYQAAVSQFEMSQSIREAAMTKNPHESKLQRDRGKAFYNLANVAVDMGNHEQAQQHIDQAIDQFTRLVGSGDTDLENNYLLAICLRRSGDFQLAAKNWDATLEFYNSALQIMEQLARHNPVVIKYQGDLAGLYMNVGYARLDQNQPVEALAAFEKAREILQPLVTQYPLPRYQQDLETTLWEIENLKPVPDTATL